MHVQRQTKFLMYYGNKGEDIHIKFNMFVFKILGVEEQLSLKKNSGCKMQ